MNLVCPNPSCAKRFRISSYVQGKTYLCPQCQTPLQANGEVAPTLAPASPASPSPTVVTGGGSGETAQTRVQGGVSTSPPATRGTGGDGGEMERTLVEGGAASSSDATLVTGADDADRTLVQGAGASEPSRIEGSSGGGSASSSEGIGFYQDVELIDQGGMGCILRATDGKIGRQVALKMLLSEVGGHPQLQRRFLNEARITGQLEHPNIVPIHEMDRTEDGRDYFSMKLIQGRSLAERVETAAKRARATGKGHDGRRWLPDFLKICDAMSFAHS
ncbi:MAG: hypothetical protein QF752_04970, partial [Planctomycetota bacterium]|nr:hypothetical protein [Planctomycetota bacterium]